MRERISRVGERWRYHVFISYAQAADLATATRLRRALQAVGCGPLRRAGRMKVFVDTRSLGASPTLSDQLAGRLDQSGSLALLASPTSRDSAWVQQELRHWLANHAGDASRPHGGLPVLVVTNGDLSWDAVSNDFDWTTPQSRQPLLRALFERRYSAQPRWVDLREKSRRRGAGHGLSRREVKAAAVQVAAGVLDLDPDLVVGEERARLASGGQDWVQRVMFQPGSTRLAISYLREREGTSAVPTGTRLWQVGSTVQEEVPGGEAAFDLEGKRLATLDADGTVTIRDVTHPDRVSRVVGSRKIPSAQSLDWSRDGSRLAVAGLTSVSVVEPDTWSVTPAAGATATMVRFAAADTLVTDSGVIRLNSGPSAVNLLKGISHAVAVRPGGSSYAVGGRWADSASGGFVALWSVDGGPLTGRPLPKARGPLALLSDDRRLAVVGEDDAVRLVTAAEGTPAAPSLAPGVLHPDAMVTTPDGRHLIAVRGRQLSVWSTDDGTVATAMLPVPVSPAGQYGGLAVSADSRTIAVTGPDGTPRLIPVHDPLAPPREIVTGSPARDLAFSRDGRLLAVATGTTGVELWDARTTTRTTVLHGTATALTFAGDWLVSTDGHQTTQHRLNDGQYRLKDGTSRSVASEPGVLGKVTRLAADSTGQLLVLGADSGASTIWELPSGRRLATLQTPLALNSLQFTSDDTQLLAAGTSVHRWSLDPEGWLRWICAVAQRNLTPEETRTLGIPKSPRPCPSTAPAQGSEDPAVPSSSSSR